MERSNLKTGDRAVLFLCVAGFTLLAIGLFMKLWVGRHLNEYLDFIGSRSASSLGLRALIIVLAVVWLLGNVIGIALAYRGRRYPSIRYAGIAALLGFIGVLTTSNTVTGTRLPAISRELWTIVTWVPIVATAAVFMFSVAWRRQRRSLLGFPRPN